MPACSSRLLHGGGARGRCATAGPPIRAGRPRAASWDAGARARGAGPSRGCEPRPATGTASEPTGARSCFGPCMGSPGPAPGADRRAETRNGATEEHARAESRGGGGGRRGQRWGVPSVLPPDRAVDQIVVGVVQVGLLVHLDQLVRRQGPLLRRHGLEGRWLRPEHHGKLPHPRHDVIQCMQVHLDQEVLVRLLSAPKRRRPLVREVLEGEGELVLLGLLLLAGGPIERVAVPVADGDLRRVLREAEPGDVLLHHVLPILGVVDLEVLQLLDGVDAVEGAFRPLRVRPQRVQRELGGAHARVGEGADALTERAVAQGLWARILADRLQHLDHGRLVHDDGRDGRGPEAGVGGVDAEDLCGQGVPVDVRRGDVVERELGLDDALTAAGEECVLRDWRD
mmetsp:Transcript_54465/g.152002  ORF Transcript_54465/g.152002 Transcript_54465/m.152002 type:complete len:398 (+) Transcript_54465:27-1220(+)